MPRPCRVGMQLPEVERRVEWPSESAAGSPAADRVSERWPGTGRHMAGGPVPVGCHTSSRCLSSRRAPTARSPGSGPARGHGTGSRPALRGPGPPGRCPRQKPEPRARSRRSHPRLPGPRRAKMPGTRRCSRSHGKPPPGTRTSAVSRSPAARYTTRHRYDNNAPHRGLGPAKQALSKSWAIQQDGTAWTSVHGEKPT
jgi:hypothetical protein